MAFGILCSLLEVLQFTFRDQDSGKKQNLTLVWASTILVANFFSLYLLFYLVALGSVSVLFSLVSCGRSPMSLAKFHSYIVHLIAYRAFKLV